MRNCLAMCFGLMLALINSVYAGTLFSDDFSGTSLDSTWEVERGYAVMDSGWVKLQGSTPGSRDTYILNHEGSVWSNYHMETRFNALGGGDDWYNSLIAFRVQDMHGWGYGTFYQLYIYQLNAHPGFPPDTVYFQKVVNGNSEAFETFHLTPGILNDTDNKVEIQAVGGDFDFIINGKLIGHIHDVNPILHGGIGLGSIWESTTRYDYVTVTTVPEPEVYAMFLVGLGTIGFIVRRKQKELVSVKILHAGKKR